MKLMRGLIVILFILSTYAAHASQIIVDWGHDWGAGWYRQRPEQQSNSPWRPLAHIDLNENDTTDDDHIGGWEFSLTDPLSPLNLVYDYTYPSARFYGAAVVKVTDLPEREDGEGFLPARAPTEGHINQNHELRDDWNLMAFPTINRKPETSQFAGGMLVFWQKADFLNGGDRHRVSFDDESAIGLFISRYWGGMNWGRWVVKEDGQFYISKDVFADETQQFDLTDSSSHDGARNPVVRLTHTINPLQTEWARYNPTPPHEVFFDPDEATFSPRTFSDVQAVGFYMQRDMSIGRPVADGLWDLPHGVGEPIALKFNAAHVRARIHTDENWSDHVTMQPIGGTEAAAIYATSEPISYHQWLQVFRWAVSNQRATRFTEGFEDLEIPGYIFLRDGAMGAMETGRGQEFSPRDPVTMISWYDAVLWCNALSELEGRTPAYYDDADFSTPVRMVFNRAKREQRDQRRPVYWKREADGYRLPTPEEFSFAMQQGAISEQSSVSEYVWDASGTMHVPEERPYHAVYGGPQRDSEAPTLIPFGERPYEGTYDVGFRVWKNGAGVPTTQPVKANRRLRKGETLMPAQPMSEARLRQAAERVLRMALVENAGGLPVNDVIERTYEQTGEYDLTFAAVTVPYRLWNAVKHWAIMNKGYHFNHAGDMGSLHYMIEGSDAFERTPEEPVTNITWLDAVVWCNALSELLGRDPVYLRKQSDEPLRDANTHRLPMYLRYGYPNLGRYESRPIDTGAIIDLRVDTTLNGFRLPSIGEFNAAHDPSSDEDRGWFATNSGRRTHPVGRKEPNRYGLYDMDGNVHEMTYGGNSLFGQVRAGNHFADPPGFYPHPITRMELPAVGRSYLGFRVVARPSASN